jgi:hypothetical protein
MLLTPHEESFLLEFGLERMVIPPVFMMEGLDF